MYYVYIVKCSDASLYTGVTTDVARRVRQHNKEIVGGAKYTATRCPVKVVFYSKHPDRSSACIEESRIKKLTRSEKIVLIEQLSRAKS